MAKRNNRNNDLAMIHIAKKDLDMDDDTYRSLLMRVTGRDSTANMSIGQRGMVLQEMQAKGWQATRKRAVASKKHHYKHPTSRLMIVLWKKLHTAGKLECGSNKCFEAWVANQVRPEGADLPISKNPDTLAPNEANAMIEQLKRWEKRI